MVHVNESALTLLLRKAAMEHEKHVRSLGKRDENWEQWYATFIVRHLRDRDDRE